MKNVLRHDREKKSESGLAIWMLHPGLVIHRSGHQHSAAASAAAALVPFDDQHAMQRKKREIDNVDGEQDVTGEWIILLVVVTEPSN